jgi:tripartite-type tricarboxylate transporter receptor subunit TctC
MIRVVVAGATGTPPDTISRIAANELAQSEGWRIVVENKGGAMQTIGAAGFSNSRPTAIGSCRSAFRPWSRPRSCPTSVSSCTLTLRP